MIAKEIERTIGKGNEDQRNWAGYLKILLVRAKRDLFRDPSEITDYDIIKRYEDSSRDSAGRIEDAILIALKRELFPDSVQARHARRLLNVFNTLKSLGFQDFPRR